MFTGIVQNLADRKYGGSIARVYDDFGKLADNFKRLEIVLRNTDATIGLSERPFTFLFNGKRSRLKHPKSLEFTVSKQAQRILARGFYKNASTNSNFLVNADYSTLVLK